MHNESVVNDLRARGIAIEKDAAAVKTEAVMITAHGASDAALARARARLDGSGGDLPAGSPRPSRHSGVGSPASIR